MQYEVYSNKNNINWNSKGKDRILQNVNNILNTIKYELPYDRLLGRDPDNLDKPLNKSRNKIIEETYELIDTYEPRAKVNSVDMYYEKNEFEENILILKTACPFKHSKIRLGSSLLTTSLSSEQTSVSLRNVASLNFLTQSMGHAFILPSRHCTTF